MFFIKLKRFRWPEFAFFVQKCCWHDGNVAGQYNGIGTKSEPQGGLPLRKV